MAFRSSGFRAIAIAALAATHAVAFAPARAQTVCGVDPGAEPRRQFERGCLAKREFARPERPKACAADRADCASDDAGAERIETLTVYGAREAEDVFAPTLEQRFAGVLVRGNPEVNGGKIRHGAFHALGMYWGADPLSFLYLNIRYGLFE